MELEPPAGCSKRPDISPAQPRRAGTRRSTGAAAASKEAKSYSLLYVEPLNDARTPLADFFNILLVYRPPVSSLRASPRIMAGSLYPTSLKAPMR